MLFGLFIEKVVFMEVKKYATTIFQKEKRIREFNIPIWLLIVYFSYYCYRGSWSSGLEGEQRPFPNPND